MDVVMFKPTVDNDRRDAIKKRFEEHDRKHGHYLTDHRPIIHPFDQKLRINWACVFNNKKNIWKPCDLIATDGHWCLVEFEDTPSEIFRAEDVEVIMLTNHTSLT